ncbi:MAG: UDP-N-acetylmuramoyl-L-alanine--D-glutamate ligase [Alphaproteobacteria bacterium]|nr:UDP-N-acetylmuramoyl-L-alanine--D-glutamate ligase [Alphaproteobacteria bacterium]
MIKSGAFAGKTFAVMGLGRSGIASAKALIASGAVVKVWDDNLEKRKNAENFNLTDFENIGLDGVDFLVWSPGIPHTLPKSHHVAEMARSLKIPLITDINLLNQAQPDAKYICITGTNGKSTTTALTKHIFSKAGFKAQIGGNFGVPVMELEPFDETGVYVLELSSYQLEIGFPVKSDVSVLLNITPDHIDRHGDMEGYISAKKRLFLNQKQNQTAIINIDDENVRHIHAEMQTVSGIKTIPTSINEIAPNGVYVKGSILIDDMDRKRAEIMDLRQAKSLQGCFNWQNVTSAYAIARINGIEPENIVDSIMTFKGLAHRQEHIATINGIDYINDSKATNAVAAENALSCYENIYWIAGGKAKEGGISDLSKYFNRIRHTFLIGEATEDFAETLKDTVQYTISETLSTAVKQAKAMAEKDDISGAVVLLSPACASFDQFSSFENRGDAFRDIVKTIKEHQAEK